MASITRPRTLSTRGLKESLLQITEVSTRVTRMTTNHTNLFTITSSTITASMRTGTSRAEKALSKLKKIDCTEAGAIEVGTCRRRAAAAGAV